MTEIMFGSKTALSTLCGCKARFVCEFDSILRVLEFTNAGLEFATLTAVGFDVGCRDGDRTSTASRTVASGRDNLPRSSLRTCSLHVD